MPENYDNTEAAQTALDKLAGWTPPNTLDHLATEVDGKTVWRHADIAAFAVVRKRQIIARRKERRNRR